LWGFGNVATILCGVGTLLSTDRLVIGTQALCLLLGDLTILDLRGDALVLIRKPAIDLRTPRMVFLLLGLVICIGGKRSKQGGGEGKCQESAIRIHDGLLIVRRQQTC